MGCIYCAQNLHNGKRYIGLTRNALSYRRNCHAREAKRGGPLPFHRAIAKYGEDLFTWKELFVSDDLGELEMAEKYYINLFDTMENGYNLQSGGKIRYRLAKESIRKMIEHRTYRGKPHTEEEKKRISESNKGKHTGPLEVNHKRNITAGLKRYYQTHKAKSGENAPCYGRTGPLHPLYGKSGKLSATSRPVLCVETNERFVSAKECSDSYGLNHSKICTVCNGGRESHSGLHFEWVS